MGCIVGKQTDAGNPSSLLWGLFPLEPYVVSFLLEGDWVGSISHWSTPTFKGWGAPGALQVRVSPAQGTDSLSGGGHP